MEEHRHLERPHPRPLRRRRAPGHLVHPSCFEMEGPESEQNTPVADAPPVPNPPPRRTSRPDDAATRTSRRTSPPGHRARPPTARAPTLSPMPDDNHTSLTGRIDAIEHNLQKLRRDTGRLSALTTRNREDLDHALADLDELLYAALATGREIVPGRRVGRTPPEPEADPPRCTHPTHDTDPPETRPAATHLIGLRSPHAGKSGQPHPPLPRCADCTSAGCSRAPRRRGSPSAGSTAASGHRADAALPVPRPSGRGAAAGDDRHRHRRRTSRHPLLRRLRRDAPGRRSSATKSPSRAPRSSCGAPARTGPERGPAIAAANIGPGERECRTSSTVRAKPRRANPQAARGDRGHPRTRARRYAPTARAPDGSCSDKNGVSRASRCECWVREKTGKLKESAGIPVRYARCAFDGFTVYANEDLEYAFGRARRFAATFPVRQEQPAAGRPERDRQDPPGRRDPQRGRRQGHRRPVLRDRGAAHPAARHLRQGLGNPGHRHPAAPEQRGPAGTGRPRGGAADPVGPEHAPRGAQRPLQPGPAHDLHQPPAAQPARARLAAVRDRRPAAVDAAPDVRRRRVRRGRLRHAGDHPDADTLETLWEERKRRASAPAARPRFSPTTASNGPSRHEREAKEPELDGQWRFAARCINTERTWRSVRAMGIQTNGQPSGLPHAHQAGKSADHDRDERDQFNHSKPLRLRRRRPAFDDSSPAIGTTQPR